MDNYTATEQAYKNGYEQGLKDGRNGKTPTAEWVVCGDGDNVPFMCSHCGKTTAYKYKVMYGNFCPNCGARMKG